VEPEHDRRKLRDDVPDQIVAASVRQFMGKERPQVVIVVQPVPRQE